jgi:DNA-binding transcriptional LysR family regulator
MVWDDVAVFVAVADGAGITAAARVLGVPKSSVSRYVARLEQQLGASLFHRTTRRVALTPAGRALYDRVAPLVAGLGRATAETAPVAPLRITTTPDLGAHLLSDVVSRYVQLHPGASVELRLGSALVDLVAEGVDLALRVYRDGLPETSALTAQKVGTLTLGLFASPGYLARAGEPTHLDDLAHHVTLGMVVTPALPPPRVRTDDTPFAHRACLAGAGVAVLPTFLADPDLASGELVRVLPSFTQWTGTVWLVSPHVRQVPPHVASFRSLLLESLRRRGWLA